MQTGPKCCAAMICEVDTWKIGFNWVEGHLMSMCFGIGTLLMHLYTLVTGW